MTPAPRASSIKTYHIKIDGRPVGSIHETHPSMAARSALFQLGLCQAQTITVERDSSEEGTWSRTYYSCSLDNDQDLVYSITAPDEPESALAVQTRVAPPT